MRSAKPKDDEKWQIELVTEEGKVYLCADTEDEMNAVVRNLQGWVDYFKAEVTTVNKEGASIQRFNISASERQNAQNLKDYYAQARRAAPPKMASSASRPDLMVVHQDPRAQIVDTDSPGRGGMYRSVSGRDLSSPTTPLKRDISDRSLALGGTPGGIAMADRLELQRDQINDLTVKLRTALEAEAAARKETEQAKKALDDKEADVKKQLDDLNSSFEGKKRQLQFLLNQKDFEIDKLRQEKQKVVESRIKELEETLGLRDREITELKAKLNDKEIEILERKETEMSLQTKFETSVATINKDAAKKVTEIQESYNRLKDRYFFALALGSKTLASRVGLDFNSMYDRCLREGVPLDQWPEWLDQFGNENQRAEGEEENVENF